MRSKLHKRKKGESTQLERVPNIEPITVILYNNFNINFLYA